MRGFLLTATSLLVAGVTARPTTEVDAFLTTRDSSCLTNADAYQVANVFADTIGKPFNTTLVELAFVPSFKDYSDSVNELINNGCPTGNATLTAPTFASRAAFIQGQSGQKPIPFEILNIWNNCDAVTLRWRTSDPASLAPSGQIEVVTGIIVLEVVPNSDSSAEYPFQIKRTFSEFNSGAWLYDLGVFVPTCS